ncbi:hypothetical protein L2D37_25690 [Vibrio harveyi]|uniref:hypothetical protein n=1 Tax=Vibrio harveyi TaxID=669 RepID=UPI003BB53EE5
MLIDVSYSGKQYFQYEEKDLIEADIPADVIEAAKAKAETDRVVALRQSAYKQESDPLYMEWQYDQTAESEKAWRDKVAEIKARYPLPSES